MPVECIRDGISLCSWFNGELFMATGMKWLLENLENDLYDFVILEQELGTYYIA